MIKKIKKEVEVLEAVKVKKEKTVYLTGDGEEFDSLEDAKHHEDFYFKKKVSRCGGWQYEVVTFEELEEMKKYIEEWFYNVDVIDFEYTDLTFPSRYVLEESVSGGKDVLKVYTKDEYESYLIEEFRKNY